MNVSQNTTSTFKLNLDALTGFDLDLQEASPGGADTDFFLTTSSPINALNEIAFEWPTTHDDELDSLFTTKNDDATALVPELTLLQGEPSLDEFRDFTAVFMTSPRKTRQPKRKLFSDDEMEARYCLRQSDVQSPQVPASPLTHYSRQRLEIAELTVVAEALERQLQAMQASRMLHGFTAYENALKAKAALLEAQEANMSLKHQVQGHLRQRQQLQTIAFGSVIGEAEDDDDRDDTPSRKKQKKQADDDDDDDDDDNDHDDDNVTLNQDDLIGVDASNIIPRARRRAAVAAMALPMNDEEDEHKEAPQSDDDEEAEF
ncbi:hypothetical protein DYB36_002817 [Aphanomyces astaci]|uniref:Uncharacterized protein n=1 Tax=Aphanomyces astaci TaxID=112090 RepID=A0A397EQC9_APHAT|nr:hypothetical protein DYB36_002817 [Aphanomyces astaci]RHY93176.1 hypothetical protein DYB31_001977 [Aphanomyces astaci]